MAEMKRVIPIMKQNGLSEGASGFVGGLFVDQWGLRIGIE